MQATRLQSHQIPSIIPAQSLPKIMLRPLLLILVANLYQFSNQSNSHSTSSVVSAAHARSTDPMPTSTAEALARETGDDDIEDCDDAVDNGHDYRSDCVDNGHDALANGPEDGFDLFNTN